MGVEVPSNPINRKEQYLAKIAGQAVEIPEEPLTREEAYLDKIAKNGSGGGGGTTNYNSLSNKPQIGGVELQGNKSLADLGIASASALANKVDKVEGKGLSTNDFTDAYKTAIGDNTNAINGIKDGQSIDSFADVETVLATKQNATDNSLQTTDKTVVGAINEHEGDIDSLKSGLTNLSEEVNGDATTYPYADVITINDAVPANLADCSVKVEPVQDLHGYDKPWVGGAGNNKINIADAEKQGTSSAITLTVSGDNISIDVDGSTYSGAYIEMSSISNGTYYLSADYAITSGVACIQCFDSSNNKIYDSGQRTTNGTISDASLTVSDGYLKVILFASWGDGIGNVTYSDVMLSTQSGMSYSPYTNICPISGHTEASVQRDGKNLAENNLDTSSALAGVTITKNPDGSMDCNGTITNTGYTRLFNDNLNLQVGQTYTISGMASTMGMRLYFLDKDQTEISRINCYGTPVTFEVPQNTVTTKANILTGSKDSVVDVTVYPQVELGSTATPYEPYKGQQYTLALGDTIYGGTVDFETGVMTVTHISASNTWGNMTNAVDRGKGITSKSFSLGTDIINTPLQVGGLCNVTDNETSNTLANIHWYTSYTNAIVFLPSDTDNDTVIQVLCQLATPTTIQLTPQQIPLLQGTNTLYASTGDISVSVNGVSGAIGALTEDVAELQGQIDEIELPSNPSADGSNLLRATTVSGETTKSWVSESLFLATVGGKLVDCNTETSNGIIRVLANSTNMPSGAGDGVLIVFRPATDNVCVQMFIESGGKISERINWYGTWSAWKTMAS